MVHTLCEWAVTSMRSGEHRCFVVAKLLERRQSELTYNNQNSNGNWYPICYYYFFLHWTNQKFLITISVSIFSRVENILKGSLDSIPSPSPSVKIQIMYGNVCLRCKGKTLLVDVNKLLKTKSLLTMPSNILPLHRKQTFPHIIRIFTEGESD